MMMGFPESVLVVFSLALFNDDGGETAGEIVSGII
jgi:hypothetical protein